MAPIERLLNEMESVCPECLKRIPAQNVKRGNDVYLIKECPEHGKFSTVIWRGEPAYESWTYPKKNSPPTVCATEIDRGCSFDCGLCPDHRQQSCCILLEITSRCNLACPVCFAGTTGGPEFCGQALECSASPA